jgi:hypothetical protein
MLAAVLVILAAGCGSAAPARHSGSSPPSPTSAAATTSPAKAYAHAITGPEAKLWADEEDLVRYDATHGQMAQAQADARKWAAAASIYKARILAAQPPPPGFSEVQRHLLAAIKASADAAAAIRSGAGPATVQLLLAVVDREFKAATDAVPPGTG